MGVPKLFKWLSERYPLISQLIQQDQIPEFDNLYLDFNAIIHQCTHPNDSNAHFRLSELQMVSAIFQYIEILFAKIKPKKVFFMAVDGVAPRAKINQQRSRRFRSAKEAKEIREAALARNEKLPQEKAFDSNSITPGTPFMARLSEQLRYFLNKKITEDADWQNIQVILSGHETPGEGEHKIMDYIRRSRAQPGYNPNTRHCLYGLDADLIMLGLLTHDPHFCLLREEVNFGPGGKKTNGSLESQKFFLLHLSLLREYLEYEFAESTTSKELEPAPVFESEHSLERIIDDFILLVIFVGNDFLPHLPDLHIHENGLDRIFHIYKEVLPQAGGYLVKQGTIDLKRLQMVLDKLSDGEIEGFRIEHRIAIHSQRKKGNSGNRKTVSNVAGAAMSRETLLEEVEQFAPTLQNLSSPRSLVLSSGVSPEDQEFLGTLASEYNLAISWDGFDNHGRSMITLSPVVADHGRLQTTGKCQQTDAISGEIADEGEGNKLVEEMDNWKRAYYKEKLGLDFDDPTKIYNLSYRYVEGLQWVMYYYYSGVASWDWFYDYHYAPKISDLNGIEDMAFSFDLGEPFKPFEQLMSVLPEASKELVPLAYRDLMYKRDSPILEFYPQVYEQDMNGKKQAWEAVVKIPFVDKQKLQDAMKPLYHRLSKAEKERNTSQAQILFKYAENHEAHYQSSFPGHFPDIPKCKCTMTKFDLPASDDVPLVEGLCEGVLLGMDALAGFPSLKTLPSTSTLGQHEVTVFQYTSRNNTVSINIQNAWESKKSADIAKELVGGRIFFNWPFLQEGAVDALSDERFKYTRDSQTPHNLREVQSWKRTAQRIRDDYSKKGGVLIGEVKRILHIRPLKGLQQMDGGSFVKQYEDAAMEIEEALQMGVTTVVSEDARYMEKGALPLAEEFPVGSKVVFLGDVGYGAAAQISSVGEAFVSITVTAIPSELEEADIIAETVRSHVRTEGPYQSSFSVAKMLNVNPLVIARITSSFLIKVADGRKVNLGLNLKSEAKKTKVLGYSRKVGTFWEFSETAVRLIQEYKDGFPDLFLSLAKQGNNNMTKPSDAFPGDDPELRVQQARAWLKLKHVGDFDLVPLICGKFSKEMIIALEAAQNTFAAKRSTKPARRVVLPNIARQYILKPAHVVYRLQKQVFNLGDRIVMAQDSGSVPFSTKGVVVGINVSSVDVIWDQPFPSGTTLDDRCSQHRGSTIPLSASLNLTSPQFVVKIQSRGTQGQHRVQNDQHGTSPTIQHRRDNQPVPVTRGRGFAATPLFTHASTDAVGPSWGPSAIEPRIAHRLATTQFSPPAPRSPTNFTPVSPSPNTWGSQSSPVTTNPRRNVPLASLNRGAPPQSGRGGAHVYNSPPSANPLTPTNGARNGSVPAWVPPSARGRGRGGGFKGY